MNDTKNMQTILSRVRRAIDNYHMIDDGDRIAVGVSGGKDSLTLLCALHALRRFYPKPFSIVPIFLDTRCPDWTHRRSVRSAAELGLELVEVPTGILYHCV